MKNLTDYELFMTTTPHADFTTIPTMDLAVGLLLNSSIAMNASSTSVASAEISSMVPDSPDPALAMFRDETRFWVQKVLLIIVGVVGLFGNAATIVVLTRRVMRSSTNTYLTALATSDFFYLFWMLWLSFMHYSAVHWPHFSFYWYIWPYAVGLADASSNTSVWLILCFTIERYIAVCHPMRRSSMCTESRARRVIVIVYLCCFAASLPTPFEWTVVETLDPSSNATRRSLKPSELGNNDTYKSIYYWFTSVTFMILPFTLLVFFNYYLIMSVKHSRFLRTKMTHNVEGADGHSHQEIRITITLIAVVIMFLICQLPTAITLIYTSFYPPAYQSNEDALLRGLGNIFNLLVCINAACNFILYCALSDKYRRTFGHTFLPCIFKPLSPHHHSMYYTYASPMDDRSGTTFRRSTSVKSPLERSCTVGVRNPHSAQGLRRQNTVHLSISTYDKHKRIGPTRNDDRSLRDPRRHSGLATFPSKDMDNQHIASSAEEECQATTTALLARDKHHSLPCTAPTKKPSILRVSCGNGKEAHLNGSRRPPSIQITIPSDYPSTLDTHTRGSDMTLL